MSKSKWSKIISMEGYLYCSPNYRLRGIHAHNLLIPLHITAKEYSFVFITIFVFQPHETTISTNHENSIYPSISIQGKENNKKKKK